MTLYTPRCERVGTNPPSSSSTTQRQVPDARNGLRGGQSANPDFIAAIDSNRRGSHIRFATLTVSQNAHRAGTVQLSINLRFYNRCTIRRNLLRQYCIFTPPKTFAHTRWALRTPMTNFSNPQCRRLNESLFVSKALPLRCHRLTERGAC